MEHIPQSLNDPFLRRRNENEAIHLHSPQSYSCSLIKIVLIFEGFLFQISFLIWILQPVWMLMCSMTHKLFNLLLSRWNHNLQYFLNQIIKLIHYPVYLLISNIIFRISTQLVKPFKTHLLFQKYFLNFILNFKLMTNFFSHYHRYHCHFNFVIKLNSKFKFWSTLIHHTLDDVFKACKYQLSILNSVYL